MMNIQFKDDEVLYQRMQQAFNDILQAHYPDALSFNHFELWQFSEKIFSPQEWKEFRSDARVHEWFQSEMTAIANNNIFKLLGKASQTNSTANIQALGQLLNFVKQTEQTQTQNVKYIYCFVPINAYEGVAENVKILQTVPTEITNAIMSFTRTQ